MAAGLRGIQSEMDPGEPIDFDVSGASEFQLKEREISWVPRNLQEAIDCLAEDSVLAQTIGRTIWEEFIKIKRTEWDKYSRYVSEWERNVFSAKF